jgi:SAM-dependent methyltransferase
LRKNKKQNDIAAMKQQLRKIIYFFPGGKTIYTTIGREYYKALERRRIRAMGGIQNVFTTIYEENSWKSDESVSGPGSTIEYTQNIVKELPRIISDLRLKRILDAPCGDYNWFRLIERDDDISYLGADIIDALISSNQERYGDDNTRFIHLDITNDALPAADLWLCRDCLYHLSNNDIFKAINNFLNSDITHLLTSSFPKSTKNTNILTGQWRLLNLELPPFSFCKPLLSVDDWIEGYPVRQLALWEKSQLSETLTANKAFQRAVKHFRH